MRAIEEGLPIIRSTPTGISAIIDADGEILQSLKLGTASRIDGNEIVRIYTNKNRPFSVTSCRLVWPCCCYY